jgi:hypothetical protein
MIRSFGHYLFTCWLVDRDPRDPLPARAAATRTELADWFSDFGHACRATRLGVGR